MPAHQAAHLLPETLGALRASTLPRAAWELIVVDDASRDDSGDVASRWADRVIQLPSPPRGPGGARNEGAKVATGDWLMFVDSDVRVHPDALALVVDVIEADPSLVAVFGSYDAHPEARGLVSEYRNLLHRYTHLTGAGEAETFWAGCGAVRRDAFRAVSGFDTARFPRPQIEDIDLGYRLRDRGGRILLDPRIQGTHLKRWTLAGMWRTDLFDRGIPWMALLIERRHQDAAALNTGRAEQIKVALAATGMLLLGAALAIGSVGVAVAGAVMLVGLVASNITIYRWFRKERGWIFALSVIPLHMSYYVGNAVAAAIGTARHLLRLPPPVLIHA